MPFGEVSPSEEQYIPAVQSIHCEEDVSFVVVEKVPFGHFGIVSPVPPSQ